MLILQIQTYAFNGRKDKAIKNAYTLNILSVYNFQKFANPFFKTWALLQNIFNLKLTQYNIAVRDFIVVPNMA